MCYFSRIHNQPISDQKTNLFIKDSKLGNFSLNVVVNYVVLKLSIHTYVGYCNTNPLKNPIFI